MRSNRADLTRIFKEMLHHYKRQSIPVKGLCDLARRLYADETWEYEYTLFKEYLREAEPDSMMSQFLWGIYEDEPRIEWLKEQIKTLENEDCKI